MRASGAGTRSRTSTPSRRRCSRVCPGVTRTRWLRARLAVGRRCARSSPCRACCGRTRPDAPFISHRVRPWPSPPFNAGSNASVSTTFPFRLFSRSSFYQFFLFSWFFLDANKVMRDDGVLLDFLPLPFFAVFSFYYFHFLQFSFHFYILPFQLSFSFFFFIFIVFVFCRLRFLVIFILPFSFSLFADFFLFFIFVRAWSSY
jgi:hypothetical protein